MTDQGFKFCSDFDSKALSTGSHHPIDGFILGLLREFISQFRVMIGRPFGMRGKTLSVLLSKSPCSQIADLFYSFHDLHLSL